MPKPIGNTRWAIAEGWIPDGSSGPEPEMTSHETLCFLNTGDHDAHVEVTLFFADREPAGPYRLTVGARRTLHQWINDLADPEPVPKATDYAMLVESNVPIVVQHTRLDTRQEAAALLSTVAFPGGTPA
jgi:hypothetical protein